MKLRTFLLVGAFVFSLSSNSFAQEAQAENGDKGDTIKFNTWSLSGGFGMAEFYGDVARAVFYPGAVKDNTFPWSAYLSGKKYFTPYLGLSATVGYNKLSSEWTADQNIFPHEGPLWFEAGLLDYDLSAEINLTNLFWPKKYNKKWSIYTVVGIGNTHYRSRLYDKDDDFVNSVGWSSNGTVKETPRAEAMITTAAGFKYRINNRWALGFEGMIKHLPSDYLDGVSKEFSEYDKYGYTGIEIEYNFGKYDEHVPMEFNPTPAEDLWVKKMIKKINEELDSINDIIDNDIDPKLDDLVNWKSKEMPDDDGDGVPNYKDLEPNTKPGAQTDTHGRTINIPVPDDSEINPDNLLQWQSVYFALDKTYLTQTSYKRIANVARIMKDHPDLKVEIVGNACRIAPNQYNMDLSKRRAERVKKALVEEFGISAARLPIVFYGEEKPLSSELLYINRRVDFRVAE